MHSYVIAALVYLAATGCAIAQSADYPKVPSTCFFSCKDQFRFLSQFSDATDASLLARVFGKPHRQITLRSGRLDYYKGADLDFIVLVSQAGRRLAVGTIGKGKPEHGRIPYMDMSGDPNQHTLNDIDLKFALDWSQEGSKPLFAERHAMWSGLNNYGRPGRYKDYAYLFRANCLPVEPSMTHTCGAEASDLLPDAAVVFVDIPQNDTERTKMTTILMELYPHIPKGDG